jgi:excisionase family DNA binding protein
LSKKSPALLAPLDPLRRYDVETAAEYLGVSRAFLFAQIKRGEIQTIRHGRRLFVPAEAIIKLSTVSQ